MKKNFSATGPNGAFYGYIEILFKAKKENKISNHRIMHEDIPIKVWYDCIRATVNANIIKEEYLPQGNISMEVVIAYEKMVQDKLHEYATKQKTKGLAEQLEEMGYTY